MTSTSSVNYKDSYFEHLVIVEEDVDFYVVFWGDTIVTYFCVLFLLLFVVIFEDIISLIAGLKHLDVAPVKFSSVFTTREHFVSFISIDIIGQIL